jgi:competence protein ComEC
MSNKNKKFQFYILAVLVAAGVLIWVEIWQAGPSKYLKTVFFDVGQGDAIFLETPARRQILIDAGPSNKILAKLGGQMPFFDNYIDIVILTHPDADHISGLIDVLRRYQVGLIIQPDVSKNLTEYQEILQIAEKKKIPVLTARAGQIIKFGDGPRAEILWPPADAQNANTANSNKSSIVSRFDFGQKSFLFSGDTEEKEERSILALESVLKSDVLKVGHHGSKYASSERFLAAIQPAFSIISVGRNNRYAHPHSDVLERLQKIGSQIFRTDVAGDIKVLTDGSALKIKP